MFLGHLGAIRQALTFDRPSSMSWNVTLSAHHGSISSSRLSSLYGFRRKLPRLSTDLIDFTPSGRVYAVYILSIRTKNPSKGDITALMLTKLLGQALQELILRLAAHRARPECTTLDTACTIALSKLRCDASIRFHDPCAT